MGENPKIIIISIVVFSLFIGIFLRIAYWQEPIIEERAEVQEEKLEEPVEEEERFGLNGWIMEANPENSFLIVKSAKDGKSLKAFIDEETRLLKIEFPEEYPEQGYVITVKTEIGVADFQKGDFVSLRSKENIAGKTEFDRVIYVYLYPFIVSADEKQKIQESSD